MSIFFTFMLYFGSAFICSKLALKAYKSKYKFNRRIYKIIIFLIPVLISTFRDATGTDSKMYISAYNNIYLISAERWNDFEFGYKALNIFLKKIEMPYQVLFFLMSCATVFFVMLFIDNEKKYIDVRVSTFIFMTDLFLISNNIMRQALVVAISLYALSVYIDGKKILAIILILISSLFHMSGLITLIAIFTQYIFKTKKYKIAIFSSSVLMLFFVFNRNLLGSIVAKLTNSAYALYLTSNVDTEGSLINYIVKNGIPLMLIFLYLNSYKNNDRMKVYAALSIVGYICLLFSVFTGTQVQRLGFNFLYLNIVLFGYISNYDCRIKYFTISKNKIKLFILCYFAFLCLFNYFIRGYNELVPYTMFM